MSNTTTLWRKFGWPASFAALVLSWPISPASSQTPAPGLRVPPGFVVTEFADDKLANDIYSMTIDAKGRVVVSGRGYIRILVDDNNDGRADRAIPFADGPKDGAQGMLWEGKSLFVTGDGGLRRYHDKDGDDRADGPSELIRALKTGGEHDAHEIRRGPDGWLYVLCGNSTRIDKSYARLATSPIKEPIAGCVLRFTPDLKSSEIVADGFRNAYGMDFNSDGELFTYDSDNERCVSLPWYEFTRFYHVMAGGHYGWQSPQRGTFWRMPPYFCDVVAPVTTVGRGSPTGVVCYRHVQFPQRYRRGMFALDWTFGKVHFLKLQRDGSSYTCDKEVFLEATGDNGFAPTAAAVHPETGDLFVSIGGRGTRGAVYRIRYSKGLEAASAAAAAHMQPKSRSLDWPGAGAPILQQCMANDLLERLRGLNSLRRHHTLLTAEQLLTAIRANWHQTDRYVRQATAGLIATLQPRERAALAKEAQTPQQQVTVLLGDVAAPDALRRAAELLTAKNSSADIRLASVRLLQRALGDVAPRRHYGSVWEGYTPRHDLETRQVALKDVPVALDALRQTFPSDQWDLGRELARTLALLADDHPGTLAKIAQLCVQSTHPVEALHYLAVLARLREPRCSEVTTRTAQTLLALDRAMESRRLQRDRHWPMRVAELYAELARNDPKLHATMIAQPEFGRPDHALFALAPVFDQRKAAEKFLARSKSDPKYQWNGQLVELMAALPAEQGLPVLRRLWGKAGLDAAILPVLARDPQPSDRPKFVQGLSSPEVTALRHSLQALRKLPANGDAKEVLAALQALGRLPQGKDGDELRRTLLEHLAKATGQKLGSDRAAWVGWFSRTHPDLAGRLSNPDGVDVAAWEKRLAKLDWAQGETERGRAVYHKTNCASCHSGSQALGPDLAGVAQRFSRADLFTALLQPSRDVSPRYQTTLIETNEGKTYQGLIVYEAVDGVILQTGAAATVRLDGKQIASQRVTPMSLMPAGLLDALPDREIADLYAYLRSLNKAP
jgi:putative membrane-bound dehydrogenase-like protein